MHTEWSIYFHLACRLFSRYFENTSNYILKTLRLLSIKRFADTHLISSSTYSSEIPAFVPWWVKTGSGAIVEHNRTIQHGELIRSLFWTGTKVLSSPDHPKYSLSLIVLLSSSARWSHMFFVWQLLSRI